MIHNSGSIQTISGNSFRVEFCDFGETGNHNFGHFVSSITLPTMSFTTHRRTGGDGKSRYTADAARWDPIQMALQDDISNEMIRQVTIQCDKQKIEPLLSHFTMSIILMDGGKDIRRYLHTGCTVIYAGHNKSVDYTEFGPNQIPYIVQAEATDIHLLGPESQRLTKTWKVPIDDGTLYDPISR